MRRVIVAMAALVAACSPKLDNGAGDPGLGSHFDTGVGEASTDAAPDATSDASADDDAPNFPDGPPPQLDAPEQDFGTAPPPEAHVDAVIDATGGTLSGLAGTPLAGVTLVVPPNALSSATTIAIDLAAPPPLPNGATGVTAYVEVGPASVVFAQPARLTLPYSTAAAPLALGMLARIGGDWGALVDPSADFTGATVTASMRRGSAAIGVQVTTIGAPSIASISPATASIGDVIFVEGKGFSLAPIVTTSASSAIAIAGANAQILGWSDTELSFVVPPGATSGAITVTTPGGSATSSDTLTIQ